MAKKLTQEDLVLNIIVNSNKAQSDIGKVTREIQDYKSKITAAESEMKRLERTNATSSTRYQKLQADVRQYNAALSDSRQRLDQLNVSLRLEDKTEKELSNTLRKLIQLRRQSVPDSDQYKEYANQITQVRNRLDELRVGSDNTGRSLLTSANRLNKYIGTIVAGGASLIAMWSGIKRATDDYAQFDDVLADVMKTTNLNKDAVKELNAELEKIDTRTNQEDLLGLGRIAGKLGYTNANEITEFVRANNQIIVALNEDLGGDVEGTVNKIGKLVDVFKLKDLYSTEEAFLKVGSAINELGMDSTANEGYMVEFSRRMAGIAPLAGITIEEILGLGATLDKLGQSEEVSSTALSKLFISMAKDAKTYAKYAGMELEPFRKYLEEDFMGAFTKVLQGVKGNAAGINELASTLGDLGQDGGRVIGVIGTLANNVDTLTGSIALSTQAMKDGTSITDEYNIKNQTAAAQLEKYRKEIAKVWRELGEKLWPVMAEGNRIGAIFLRLITTTISFISNNIKVITTLVLSLTAYYVVVQLMAKWEVITTAAMAAKRIVGIALSGVYAALTGNITRAVAAQRMLNLTMMANPYALLVAGFVALIAVVVNYNEKLRGIVDAQGLLSKAMRSAGDETAGETLRITSLNKVMTDTNESMENRISAMEQIKKIMPDVLAGYTQEEVLAGKARNAINEYTESLILNAQIKAKQVELDDLALKSRKIERNEVGFLAGAYREVRKVIIGATLATAANALDNVESLTNIKQASKELTNSMMDDQAKLRKLKSGEVDPGTSTKVAISDPKAEKDAKAAAEKAKREEERAQKAEEKLKESIDKQIESWKKLSSVQGEEMDKQLADLESKYKEFLSLTEKNQQQRTEVASMYAALRLKREHEIDMENAKIQLEEQKRLADRKLVQQQADIDRELALQMTAINSSNETETHKNNELTRLQEEARQKRLLAEQEDMATRVLLLEAAIASGDLEINETRRVAEEKNKIQHDLTNSQIAEAQREQKERLEIEKQTNDALFSLKQETMKAYEAAFSLVGSFFKENSDAAKLFLVLEKAAAAASVIINLQKEIAGYYAAAALQSAVNPFGSLAYQALATKQSIVAKVRAGVSLASIAATAIKGVTAKSSSSGGDSDRPIVKGRERGGYFSVERAQDGKIFNARMNPRQRGYVKSPTVLVGENGKEWVANADAVNNPTIKPIIDIIDVAQRNGTINTINLSEIISGTKLSARIPGRQEGGAFGGNLNSPPLYDQRMVSVLDRLDNRLGQLDNRLKNLKAEVSLLGKGGFVEKMDELNNIQNTANL